MRTVYEEGQTFSLWAYLASIGAVAIGPPVILAATFSTGQPLRPSLWIFILVMYAAGVGFLLNIFFLNTRVTNEQIELRLGYLVPIAWTRIPLRDIIATRAVKYRPLLDAGGWGVRCGRFEGERCRYWNARGDRGVLIHTPDRRYIIGSQTPERLKTAIDEARRSNA
mgnify:CR=1 FL=1